MSWPTNGSGGASNFSQLQGNATDNASLKAILVGKLWLFNGAPSNATGFDGDHGVRIDKPFQGIPYTKVSGAWVVDDNTYTLATLPTASASYLGLVLRVNDATPAGLDFECVTYDGGTSYYWVPSRGSWLILNDTTAKTAFTGSASGTISGTAYTFPNRTDMFPPGIMVEFETLSSVTNSTNAKTVSITNSPATVTLHQTSTSTTGIIALSQRSRLQYTGASSTVEFSYSGSGAGFGSASVAPQNINIALANMPIVYTAALGLTSESITLLTRRIRIEYQ